MQTEIAAAQEHMATQKMLMNECIVVIQQQGMVMRAAAQRGEEILNHLHAESQWLYKLWHHVQNKQDRPPPEATSIVPELAVAPPNAPGSAATNAACAPDFAAADAPAASLPLGSSMPACASESAGTALGTFRSDGASSSCSRHVTTGRHSCALTPLCSSCGYGEAAPTCGGSLSSASREDGATATYSHMSWDCIQGVLNLPPAAPSTAPALPATSPSHRAAAAAAMPPPPSLHQRFAKVRPATTRHIPAPASEVADASRFSHL
jgi:hypothetical protein